jgi:hypothetical protein
MLFARENCIQDQIWKIKKVQIVEQYRVTLETATPHSNFRVP